MEALRYSKFEVLRLRTVLAVKRVVENVTDQEWMGGVWEGEAIGFTGFWCLDDEPNRVGGIEIDFSELDGDEEKELQRCLSCLFGMA